MMANIVSGLFGLTPEQVAQQQRAQMINASNQYASADPMQRAQAGLFQLGAGLGNVGAEMSGGVNTQVQSAQQEQALSQGIDFTNVDSIIKGSQRAEQAGNAQFAQKLADYARTIQEQNVNNQFKQAQYAPKPEKPADTDIVTKQLGNGWRQDFVVDKQNNIIRPWSERYRDAEKTSGGSSGGGKPDGSSEKDQAAADSLRVMLDSANDLLNHPGRKMGTGASSIVAPYLLGTQGKNFSSKLETFKAQTFVPMVSQLKGMGALSDAEGKKLTEAVGALDTGMSEPEFKASLQALLDEMNMKYARIAGTPWTPTTTRSMQDDVLSGRNTSSGMIKKSATPAAGGYDAAKEARYQAWKAQQGK